MTRISVSSVAIVLLALTGVRAQEPTTRPALRGLDPIELAKGKEVAGVADVTGTYGRYHYNFATPANKAAFEKEPRRYAIQIAGACARMGPLCGAGNPDRFFIHDQRIYLFASDICRDNFKKDPAKHIDLPDAAPSGTAEEQRGGRRLIDLALKGLGGADKVDRVKNVQTTLPRSYGTGKDKVDGILMTTIEFPDRLRNDETWGKWQGAHALNGPHSFERTGDAKRALEEVEREYLTRELHRHPLAILKARNRPEFIALAAAKGKIGERECERVMVALAGATSTLSLDPETGRVLAIAYTGRPGIGPIGAVEKTFSDFKAIDGVVLPHAVRMTWDGKLIPNQSGTYSAVRVSSDLGADFFRAPAAK